MMSQNLFKQVDPAELGKSFSSSGFDNTAPWAHRTKGQRTLFRVGLSKIPRREMEMWCAHTVWHKGQEEIARTHEVTQGDVSYRIKRAKERISLWMKLCEFFSEAELRDILYYDLKSTPQEVSVVLGIYKTTSQSVCAKILNMSQGSVRHDFIAVKDRLQERLKTEDSTALKKLNDLMDLLSRNYNRLRELGHQKRFMHKFKD